MKFKIKYNENNKHSEICNSVAWTLGNEVVKFMQLDGYPTDISLLPQSSFNEQFALGFADGFFKIINKNGKIEKAQEAHKGALISLKWSNDGQSLVTCGEDGIIKTWSKTGNLRSQLVTLSKPIYCVCWSPDNDAILLACDNKLYIKPLQAGQKQIQWVAHEGVVLKCDWNSSNNLIISGGEDCKYKIWDIYGRLLFSSSTYDYVITSIAWAPNGEYFTVGSYEMLKLCDKTGWTQSFNKVNTGSILDIKWSSDSTICACACGQGQVIFGYIVEKVISKDNWELQLTDDNRIHVLDLVNEISEVLDLNDRVINMSLGYNNFIVTTSTQCYIYSTQNWQTPNIFDLKEPVSIILQSAKYFALVLVTSGIIIFNYEGRQISNPKIGTFKFDCMNKKKITMSQDILAVVDNANNKQVKFYDLATGKQLNFILDHHMDFVEIMLNQNEFANERKIGFIDVNRDLYISPVHKRNTYKLTSNCDSFLWSEINDILVCISDQKLIQWYYPNAIYVDKDLMDICKNIKENTEIGRNAQLVNFSNNATQVYVRRKDGGLVILNISPYPSILFQFTSKQKWDKAIKLCRFVNDHTLWACLAAISLYCRELNTAEIALAAIECIDKLPSQISKNAALLMYCHKFEEAEQQLLHNKLFYRAIKLNIKLYKWERALEIALSTNTHLDTLIGYRQKYLQRIGKQEFLPKFQKYGKEKISWDAIKENIKKENENEAKLQ